MKTLALIVTAALCPVWVALAGEAAPPSAAAIMQAVKARSEGHTRTATLEMMMTDKGGNQRQSRLRSFLKERETDGSRLRAMFLLSPADVKDTALLTHDYDSGEQQDDQWLYLPSLKKVKRIATGDQSSSFLGSDFSYADLTRIETERYDYKLMRESEVEGQAVWQIEATPRDRAEIERTGSTKSILFVRKDCYFIVRAVYFLARGERLKYLDVRRLEQIGGVWVGTEVQMTTKSGEQVLHRTVLTTSDVQIDGDVEDDLFTVRRLEKGA